MPGRAERRRHRRWSSATDTTITGSHSAGGHRPSIQLRPARPDHGIETDERGFFTIDGRFQTSVPGVWALGDVNGHGAFTHTAYQDGQILLDPPRTVDGRVTIYAMYTDPPLGRVGMTVSEARESGRNVLKAEVPMSSVSRAVLEGETTGLMRILVDADTEEFLGATILGLHGDDLIQIIGTAMQAGVRYPAVRDALPIHPTMAEFIPSALGLAQASGLNVHWLLFASDEGVKSDALSARVQSHIATFPVTSVGSRPSRTMTATDVRMELMAQDDWLADRFEQHRSHLRAVAYRMLGSVSDADDAVQEAWIRLSRSDSSAVENLGGWLTTVVARVALDMLRSRTSRREEPVGEVPAPPADERHIRS